MRTLTAIAVLAAAACAMVLSQPSSADSTFAPSSSVTLCNRLPVPFVDSSLNGNTACADVLTTSNPADTSFQLALPSSDVAAVTNVTFVPGTITAGGTIPAGTKLGGIHQTATLGLNNGTCSNTVNSQFILYNVALPNNPGAPLSSTNLAYPQAQGTVDRFSKWKVGSVPGGGDPSGLGFFDAGHADGTSIPFQNYPRYLLDAYGNLIPTAAYGGLTLSEGEWTPIFLLQFAAGQLSTLPGPYSLMNASMGAPLVTVRGDPTATVPSPSNITDTCTPSSSTVMLLGRDQSLTYTRATTPAASGTQMYLQYLASGRDTDQDGFENAIDTCPFSTNVASPKTGGVDNDGDGIDDSCDTAVTPFPSDIDLDGYDNRQDNCPETSNPTQAESETASPTDLGPVRDDIGDPCETATPIVITQNGTSVTITPSTTVANGRYMTRTNVIPKCFGGTDADGDGYCTSGGVTTDNADSGTCETTSPPGAYAGTWVANGCYFRHTLWSGASHPTNFLDSDGDTVAASPTSYFTDAIETYLGTDPTKPCAATRAPGNANNEGPLDNWPLDFDDNGNVGIGDYLKYNTVLSSANGGNRAINQGGNGDGGIQTIATITGAALGGTFPQNRYDLNLDGFLSTADLGKFSQYMTKACGVAGAAPIFPNGGAVFQQ